MSEEFPVENCILAPDGVYSLHIYKNEKELESFVLKNSAQIFGAESVYFDIKQKVESKAKTRITDGFLLDLNDSGNPKFWIVEIELASHDLYKDVEPQVRGFLRALNLEDTLTVIRNTLYEELRKDRRKLNLVREASGEDDAHYFVEKVLRTKAGVIVVIDSVTPQLEEIVEELSANNEVRVIEFKTYERDKKLLHGFTPLSASKGERAQLPDFKTNWFARLKWVEPETRTLSQELIKRIEMDLPVVKHAPGYRWYYFYSTNEMKPHSRFAVILLDKKKIHVRISVDPGSFRDPETKAKDYKGWFWKEKGHVEKGFEVATVNDIPYALTLIKQSYGRDRK